MNYTRIYNSLVERARERTLSGYVEKHHIVPKCLDGTNAKENIVKLTAREHFVAHLLLVKIYPENVKIKFALRAMCRLVSKCHMNNRKFAELRLLKNLHSGIKRSAETKRKMREAQKGRIITDEHRKKLSNSNAGQIPWSKGKLFSEEHKRKLSESHKGKTYTKRNKE